MDKILEKYLIRKYPKIFVEMYGPANKTCMHSGIGCGNGWFHIIDLLCNKIQFLIEFENDMTRSKSIYVSLIPQVVAKQIKEKFGTLHFYYEGGNEEIRNYVDMIEEMSSIICEECGMCNETVGTTTGWIRTLCPNCPKKHLKDPFRKTEKFIQDKEKLALFKKVNSNKRKK